MKIEWRILTFVAKQSELRPYTSRIESTKPKTGLTNTNTQRRNLQLRHKRGLGSSTLKMACQTTDFSSVTSFNLVTPDMDRPAIPMVSVHVYFQTSSVKVMQ